MAKTQQLAENPRSAIVRITASAMETNEVDLNVLLACCRRELSFRERVYPRMAANGKITEAKAEKEIELMRQVCAFLVHCVFVSVTRNRC